MPDLSQYFPITDPTIIFFVVLLIILFAPIIMGKLRIPHIIGMVLAGMAIGSYGLNILSRAPLSSSSARWACTTSCSSPPWRWIWRA